MTSEALTGHRCRVTKPIESPAGRIERFAKGTVQYVTENLGRLLVTVEWDAGGKTILFPEEIEILEHAASHEGAN